MSAEGIASLSVAPASVPVPLLPAAQNRHGGRRYGKNALPQRLASHAKLH